MPAAALQAITGQKWGRDPVTADNLVTFWNNGNLMVLCSGDKVNDSRLVTDHAYVVAGYDAQTGLFTIENPWGSDSQGWAPGSNQKCFGLFTASPSWLAQNFIEMDIAG